MAKKETEDIVKSVREFLNASESISSVELLSRLNKKRNESHPDLFTDNEAKEKAEEYFKQANSLLSKLRSHIERERAETLPANVTENSVSEYQLFDKESEIIEYQEDIKQLKQENRILQNNVDRMKSEMALRDNTIKELRENKTNESYEELREVYKVKGKDGIWGLTTIALYVTAQIKGVSTFLTGTLLIDYTMCRMLMLLLAYILIGWLVYKRIALFCAKTITKGICNDKIFLESHIVVEKGSYRSNYYLKESSVQNEVRRKITSARYAWLYFWRKEITVSAITRCIINELLLNRILKESTIKGVDRHFVVNPPASTKENYSSFDIE